MTKTQTVLLWILQAVLAALFLFAGGYKLVTPSATLAQQTHMSAAFIKFIGVCEVLGALGLILPGLLKIRTELTPIAAGGLVIIMIGAVVVTLMQGLGAQAVFPAIVGILAAVVVYGRTRHPAGVATS